MRKEEKFTVRAQTPGELAALYNVSIKTLMHWIKKHAAEVGPRHSRYYTVQQVRILYECIGAPETFFDEK